MRVKSVILPHSIRMLGGEVHESVAPQLIPNWTGSVLRTESTFHQLSPYIGKIKSSIAASLVAQFTKPGDLVYDAFSGSGTVALEAWSGKRRVIANDLSPYAQLLTNAKLFPCKTLEEALDEIEQISKDAQDRMSGLDLRRVPRWIREFFHPRTLRETLAWVAALRARKNSFLLASLLGILHHQRPGFLSYPSSHTVPYLRIKKFPPSQFPELYKYRSLRDRLEAKVRRAFRRTPELDFSVERSCYRRDASGFVPATDVDAIITSPPYMRVLDYGRDNRLRLWFLGSSDWRALDQAISPRHDPFLKLMRSCFHTWHKVLKPNQYCILIVGDIFGQSAHANLPEVVSRIATDEVGGYVRACAHTEMIPNERRVRRGIRGSTSETVIVLRRSGHIF